MKGKLSRPAKPARRSTTSRLRAMTDEIGVTTPKAARRSSAGVPRAPRARPRKIR